MKLTPDFRSRVLAREWLAGGWLNLGSPVTAEVAGTLGYDWLLLDHEHGPGGEDTLLAQLHAVSGSTAVTIVRIPAHDPARYKRTLDLGAHGVMTPYINTAAEAQAMVSAMRYPPHGSRGVAKFHRGAAFGGEFEDYYLHAHERIVAVAQLETPEAVTNAADIAAVDGIDVLFVGPTDLTYNLGIRDQFDHPRFLAAVNTVVQAARAHGKAAGILVHAASLVAKCREWGFTFVALGSDGGAVRAGMLQNLQTLRAN
jgi:2-keto-3-deoxy-L-rhamnonate aldolase RhmA